MLGEELLTVILIILYTKALSRVMNHHPKILILPMDHEGTILTLLLLVKHHQNKSCSSDWLLGHLTKDQKEIQFVITQKQTAW